MNLFDEDSVIMANVRALATAALLMTFASGASIAMPRQDIPPEVKSCKAISDEKERLKCFDGVFAEPSKPQKPQQERQVEEPPEQKQMKEPSEEKQANWSIDESESPTGGSPQVVAANLVDDTVLILRCKEQTTEAAFSTKYNYLGFKSVDVQLRINDQNPVKEVWKASMNGRAAFAPDAVAFIQSLPDNAKLSIKTTRSPDGKVKEGNFNLSAVSEVRDKISKACGWANGSVDEPVGSIDHPEKR
jgi:type VI secretion system VasI family protein